MSVLVKLFQGSLLMGTCSCLVPSVGEAVKRFQGSQVTPCQPVHGLCTICQIADKTRAGRFRAKSRAEGSQKTALSPSAALAQGHLSFSHTAKRRELEKVNVFLFSNISSSQTGSCE